jgi:hypothetical protein
LQDSVREEVPLTAGRVQPTNQQYVDLYRRERAATEDGISVDVLPTDTVGVALDATGDSSFHGAGDDQDLVTASSIGLGRKVQNQAKNLVPVHYLRYESGQPKSRKA